MTKFPQVTGEEIIKALVKAGFKVMRQKGSHVYLKHNDGRATVVPVHKGETIGTGLMSKILRDIDINKEDFLSLL